MKTMLYGRKLLNYVKVAINYNFELSIRTDPVLVQLDIIGNCNLRCVMCPNRKVERPKGMMSLELFKDVVEQTSTRAREYSVGVCGEPALHPDLSEMIKQIKDRDCSVTLNTNLNYQQDDLSESLVRQKVDRIIITMCGADKATYESICVNGDFDRVMNNLKRIKHFKEKFKQKKPRIVANFTEMKANVHQRDSVKKTLGEYIDYCNLSKMHDWGGDEEIKKLKLAEEEKFDNRRCSRLWTSVVIWPDGRISPCCQDYQGKIILGDAKITKINDIWNSADTDRFRKHYANSALCHDCTSSARHQFSVKNVYYTLKTSL